MRCEECKHNVDPPWMRECGDKCGDPNPHKYMTIQQQKNFVVALEAWWEKREEQRIIKKYP